MERRKSGLGPYADSRTKPLSEVVARNQPMALAPVLAPQGLIESLACSQSIRSLSEQLGAASAHNGSARILMAGCRPGDGVSTIAAAMALDMSQRLAARTVLVQGQPQVATMHPLFGRASAPISATPPAHRSPCNGPDSRGSRPRGRSRWRWRSSRLGWSKTWMNC